MRYVFANCEVDTQISAVRQGTKYGKLRAKPFQVLCYLLEHADRVVSRQELIDQFWPDHKVSERTVHNTVLTVSRAIGDKQPKLGIIQIFPNSGYRITVPVTVIAEEAATASPTLPPPPDGPLHDAPVRRQLTVLFCDLVVSALHASTVDPEDHIEAVHTCHETYTAIITRYEGHVAQRLGDGFLVYFGYPNAHEDDAQRAVYSAMGMMETTAPVNDRLKLSHGITIAVQIGIHTGVSVANAQWAKSEAESLAFGEVPAVAMRLQECLAPNTIGISAATYRLVRGYFSCQSLGAWTLRGFSGPIDLYQVLQKRHVRSRFGAAMMTRDLTSMVGREYELDLLLGRWDQARNGVGSVICIYGDAGIGKSRLIQAFKEQVGSDASTVLECQTSPYDQRTAFWPLIGLIDQLCQWGQHEHPDMKVKKLETMLSQFTLPREETLALFADLLSLAPRDGDETLRHMSPHHRRRRITEALLTIIFELADQGPIVLVIEDLQWADSSTLDLLGLLLNHLVRARIFILLTSRSDFNLSLNGQLSVTDLRLESLTNPQVEHMILQLTNGKELPAAVMRQLVAKVDGIPLFVEEITRMVFDSGHVVERDDHYELGEERQELAIPTTLHDSLIARLDRLEIGQKTAQLAATIGREFSYPLIRAVVGVTESTLQRELVQLVEADLLDQHGLPPQAHYSFKHVLIQEAAYQSLSRQTRRQYHQQIVRVLEKEFPETCTSQPERLAHHYTEAGLLHQSVTYWRQAAQQAFDRRAIFDAEAHAQQGLAVISTLSEGDERVQHELNFQILLCKTALYSERSRDAKDNLPFQLQRTYELCEQVGNLSQRGEALGELGYCHLMRAEFVTAHRRSEQLLELAHRENDPILLRKGHQDAATALFFLGAQTDAMQHLKQALPDDWEPLPFELTPHHSQIAEAAVLRYQAWVRWLQGYPDQASRALDRALQLSQHNIYSLGVDMFFKLVLHQWRGEPDVIHTQIDTLIDHAQEYRLNWSVDRNRILQGWSLAHQGQPSAGIDLVRRGITDYRAVGSELFLTYFLALLAELYGQTADIETGLETISEALTLVDQTGERCWEAELHRIRAELLLQQTSPNVAEAESALHQALTVAREQQVKALELRATTSLARLRCQQGKRSEALHLLEPIYSWFTEGHDTADLNDARRLLHGLT